MLEHLQREELSYKKVCKILVSKIQNRLKHKNCEEKVFVYCDIYKMYGPQIISKKLSLNTHSNATFTKSRHN